MFGIKRNATTCDWELFEIKHDGKIDIICGFPSAIDAIKHYRKNKPDIPNLATAVRKITREYEIVD